MVDHPAEDSAAPGKAPSSKIGWDRDEPSVRRISAARDKLYALGFSGLLCALDKSSGKLVWSHDLVAEYAAKQPQYGFATSPLAHGESLIVPVGGTGFGVAAFALADGKLLWHAHDF